MIHRIEPVLFPFAWGSPTAIPELLGTEATGDPVAEAWFGELAKVLPADPADPAADDGAAVTLGELIGRDPVRTLGHARIDDPRHELPYLVKFLAADWPLSIQVHPSAEAAEIGFAREEALGIPVSHPARTYRDRNAKPEAILALGHFELLAGFRPPAEVAGLVEALSLRSLGAVTGILAAADGAADAQLLRAVVTEVCGWEVDAVGRAVAEIGTACDGAVPPEFAAVAPWIAGLAREFPNDVGVIIALLMNHLVLERFDLAFVDVGVVHSYLGGTGLEVMGNSDNVVRGGLTIKHVDVLDLLRQLDFRPGGPFVVRAGEREESGRFDVPTDRFDLSLLEIGGTEDGSTFGVDAGPEVLVVLEGSVTAIAADVGVGVGDGVGGAAGAFGEPVRLDRGSALFVEAVTDRYRLDGRGLVARVAASAPAARSTSPGEDV